MNKDFSYAIKEIKKYAEGVHILNKGAKERELSCFEETFGMFLPRVYKEWLKNYNGGEFFALPVGTCFAGVLGASERKRGVLYLEDNFIREKRVGVLNTLFIVGSLCDGEIVGFDLKNTNAEDGKIIQYDVETGTITFEWGGFSEWITHVLDEGSKTFNYAGEEI